ncbi:A disintegrin and metallo ase with thrombospondin motifs 9 [Paramuricea clavata]|uniref:A disintegrin and metallo ase with thrombospondin motifs 9 n=1 Tax=Paramuricea clavata TaxID=317549 RepID=A0A6S7JB74_PARCT|nr:A disintegrin and metallo ase with thrombospondin motifs 9 [Paramuricea clavata]
MTLYLQCSASSSFTKHNVEIHMTLYLQCSTSSSFTKHNVEIHMTLYLQCSTSSSFTKHNVEIHMTLYLQCSTSSSFTKHNVETYMTLYLQCFTSSSFTKHNVEIHMTLYLQCSTSSSFTKHNVEIYMTLYLQCSTSSNFTKHNVEIYMTLYLQCSASSNFTKHNVETYMTLYLQCSTSSSFTKHNVEIYITLYLQCSASSNFTKHNVETYMTLYLQCSTSSSFTKHNVETYMTLYLQCSTSSSFTKHNVETYMTLYLQCSTSSSFTKHNVETYMTLYLQCSTSSNFTKHNVEIYMTLYLQCSTSSSFTKHNVEIYMTLYLQCSASSNFTKHNVETYMTLYLQCSTSSSFTKHNVETYMTLYLQCSTSSSFTKHNVEIYMTLYLQCSANCGPGKSERSVRCRIDSSFVEDGFCSKQDKPNHEKSCNRKKCEPQNNRYKWFATSFSPCSTTCGGGIQSRMVICVNESERQVPSRNCDSENKPPKVTVCNNEECLPQWSVGHWSECSTSCGEGVQTRTVACPEKDENSNDLCDKNNKSSLERRCNRGPCNSSYTWKTGPWSKCSATCGEATMRRAVKCLGRNNQYGIETRCLRQGFIKPDDTRECLLPKCEPRSCKDIQTQLGKQEDTEFNITIASKRIQVYCYGMLTNNPKEYMTLKSGPQHNFAEYYHRSLKNPSKCPYNGARNDDCPLCHRELFPTSGGTYFSKVRFDVSRMSIIGGDFTFAITRGNHSPSYGTAGDCYSKSQCPQGRFSIDLTNTGISISPEVTWKSYGYYLSRVITMKEGRQIVTGMCGGYCGVCRPYRTLRVAL